MGIPMTSIGGTATSSGIAVASVLEAVGEDGVDLFGQALGATTTMAGSVTVISNPKGEVEPRVQINTTQEYIESLTTEQLAELDNQLSQKEENFITIGDKTYKLEEVENTKEEKTNTYKKTK